MEKMLEKEYIALINKLNQEIERLKEELKESQNNFDFLSGGQSLDEIFGREM